MKLLFDALVKFVLGFIFISLFLFLPANTFNYWYGWLFIIVLFVPVLIMGIVLYFKAPDLLAKRLKNKEKEETQKGFKTAYLIL